VPSREAGLAPIFLKVFFSSGSSDGRTVTVGLPQQKIPLGAIGSTPILERENGAAAAGSQGEYKQRL